MNTFVYNLFEGQGTSRVASSFFLIVRQVDGLGMNAYQVKTEKKPGLLCWIHDDDLKPLGG